MKKKVLLNLLKVFMVIVFFSIPEAKALNNEPPGEFEPIEPDRIPSILTMILNRTESNYNQIRSWRGKLEITTDYVYQGDRAKKVFIESIKSSGQAPSKLLEHRETNIEFSLDAENELLFANYYNDSVTPLEYTDLENGNILEVNGWLATRRAILTPKYQIDCLDIKQEGVVISRIAVKQIACPEKNSNCDGHPVYDPRRSLSIGDQIWEFLPRLIKYINEHGKYSVDEYNLQVEERKTGDTIDYRIILPGRIQGDENYLFHKMVFSGDNGFNGVLLETTYHNQNDSRSIMFKRKMLEYEQFGSVYVPRLTIEQEFDVMSGDIENEQTIHFKEQKINAPISADTFTYKNLGLQTGDRFVDKIVNKEYEYQDGEFIEIEK